MLLPVIMAGGNGSRLWPLSQERFPKQFLCLHSVDSMLQETLKRLQGLEINEPIVICNEEHRFIVAEQLNKINMLSHNIILEPIGRNTAPAIALAALSEVAKGNDPVMLVLAADHIIKDIKAFHDSIAIAFPFAKNGSLVTFGIVPTGPETGYGYIQRGSSLDQDGLVTAVRRFVEKPDLNTAQDYVNSGEYLWNSGMFMFHAQRYLDELNKFRPDILSACQLSLQQAEQDKNFINVDRLAFNHCPSESIDYAVMEKTHDTVMVPLNAGWSDVGSWDSLWEISQKDDVGNVLRGDTFLHDTSNCYINTNEKLVAAIGVDNLVIVNTEDAILVANKSNVQDVKKVVEYLKTNKFNRDENLNDENLNKVFPLRRENNSLVDKKFPNISYITVDPGEALSSQVENNYMEHWIIVAGTAKLITGNKSLLLKENQSISISLSSVHRLENSENIPLELIRIRLNHQLSSDNVVRIKDYVLAVKF